jgi:hypothetical protein
MMKSRERRCRTVPLTMQVAADEVIDARCLLHCMNRPGGNQTRIS